MVSTFTHSQVVLNLNEFLSSVKLKLFLRVWETKQLLIPSDFIFIYIFIQLLYIFFLLSKSVGTSNCLVTHILQNIFFVFSTRIKNVYRFGTWQWVNKDIIYIFGWTIFHLSSPHNSPFPSINNFIPLEYFFSTIKTLTKPLPWSKSWVAALGWPKSTSLLPLK